MIRILIDASSDYMMEDAKKDNFEFVPLSVLINDTTYLSGINITADGFYEKLTATKEFPKTAQPSPQDFLNIFEDAKEKGDSVICILLSSSLSGTCQCAHLAKNMADYDNIHIIDSCTAAVAIRTIAEYAQKLVNEGLTAEEIVEKVEAMKSKVKILAAVDTLEYLARGGRLNRTVAAIGELANLKPIITVSKEGSVEIAGKALGRIKAVNFILTQLATKDLDPDFPLYGVYTYGLENIDKLEKKLEKEGYKLDAKHQLGATIGTHVGPGAFGVIYVEK